MSARGTFSSARKVRSSTAPPATFLSLVRTNAPPLPGFTCWNSTTVTRPSDGRLRAMPFFRSLVEMLKEQRSQNQVLRKFGEGIGAVGGDDHRVLDADAAHTREVHARLDRDDRTALQGITGTRGHPRLLVDLEPYTMTGAVHERVAPAGGVDDLATGAVDGRAVGAGAHRFAPGPLALAHDIPHAPRLPTGVADADGAGHVGAVPVDDAPEVDDDELARLDAARARAGVRLGAVRSRRADPGEAGG